MSEVDRRFFTFLQAALVAGVDTGLTAADVEALVPAMDAAPRRQGRRVRRGDGASAGGELPGRLGRPRRSRAPTSETGNLFSDRRRPPSGLFAKVDPCAAVVPGRRLAPVNAALLRLLDATYGTSFGPMEPAPDVRAVA